MLKQHCNFSGLVPQEAISSTALSQKMSVLVMNLWEIVNKISTRNNEHSSIKIFSSCGKAASPLNQILQKAALTERRSLVQTQ